MWPINRIECVSQYGPCNDEITKELELKKRIYKRNIGKYIDEKLRGESRISSYGYYFKFPFSEKVSIIEKKAQVALKFSDDDNYYLYTSEGEKVNSSQKTETPVINVAGSIKDNDLKFATELAYELFKDYDIKEIKLENDKIEFNYHNYGIIFPVKGDMDVLLGSFELVLSWLNSSSQDLKINLVDFRYKNPIVKSI